MLPLNSKSLVGRYNWREFVFLSAELLLYIISGPTVRGAPPLLVGGALADDAEFSLLSIPRKSVVSGARQSERERVPVCCYLHAPPPRCFASSS